MTIKWMHNDLKITVRESLSTVQNHTGVLVSCHMVQSWTVCSPGFLLMTWMKEWMEHFRK